MPSGGVAPAPPYCFKSSNIQCWAWTAATGTLWVLFDNGAEYHYFGVAPLEIEMFQRAESPGKFLHKNIRPNRAYTRVA